MRIVVVSAHYPPNFVSGGTLVPQRIARGMRARGHDVYVYAGWLEDERVPLGAWSDVDETGLPVRWVVVTPWTGHAVRENYDNPGVTADFRRFLAAVRPDVVHLHSLQTMGAGLVDAATAAGARTVVTMHDFWWMCARNFLVTPQYVPCCPVVSCGVCPCQVDHDWLLQRDGELARRLARVDMVLAVSQVQAEILAANGVDPARLRVDENGSPAGALPPSALQPPPRPARHGSAVRFAYGGGPNPYKGAHVILEAASQLARRRDGWSLTTYDIDRIGVFYDASSIDLTGVPIERKPAFDHDRIDEVFDAMDVLVLPSLSETYSLLTREALARGVPVVASACYGPEEVVEHGVNGLLVKPGDAADLAAAMESLIAEPALIESLSGGARLDHVRSDEEQVEGLDRLYGELVEGVAAPPLIRRRVRRVLFVVGITGAPLRYRAQLPAEALALLGVQAEVRHYRDPALLALAERADAVVVYRVPATIQIDELLSGLRARGTPLFFDVDDLIFDPDIFDDIASLETLPRQERDLYLQGMRRYRTTMERCDAFIGSTEALCHHAEHTTGLPAHRFANGVGLVLGQLCDQALAQPRSPGPLRIAYLSGTSTHDLDWRFVEPAVAEVLDALPDVELWLGGVVNPTAALDRFHERVRRLPFVAWTDLPAILRDVDVNLAPLEPGSRFNEAKSAIKWLEAALVATPTVATPTEPFREAVVHGVTGMLAERRKEWADSVRLLLEDTAARHRIGEAARRSALLRWSPHLQARRYLDILENGRLAAPDRQSDWVPVALDEPPEPTGVDRYPPLAVETRPPPGEPQPVVAGRLSRARQLAGRARRVGADEGVAEVARRAAAVTKRQLPKVERRVRSAVGKYRARPERRDQ